ncbi:MAG: hypothetical protein IIB44_13820 [Candidatus Marinimicrobia bacterium]|nr:hypothetical protein [Candidatus Neomarinimicrobiota bacterium]
MIACLITGFAVGLYKNPGLRSWDFKDPVSMITKLHNAEDHLSSYIRGLLRTNTQQLIDRYESPGVVSDSLKKAVRKDLNRLLRRGKLLFGEEELEQLALSEEITEMISKNPGGRNLVVLNRLLLGWAFPDEITEKPQPILLSIFDIFSLMLKEVEGIATYFVIIICVVILVTLGLVAYSVAFKTIRVMFSDVRHVDKILEYFVEQMGFKAPIKDKGNLIYKPTLKKFLKEILIGFPSKIRARVDGNSVIITSTIPVVRRLEKQFKSFSQ